MSPENTTSIVLRDYQLELFYKIKDPSSCILFLPTGSGKTHVAFWMIKSMAADLKKPIKEGGKRAFFLVNTVHLVRQQGALLAELGNFRVSCLTGDMKVDNSKKNFWISLTQKFEVFVMTSQIYLNALIHGYLSLENANLLVFDECHHATGDHPMSQIIRRVHDCRPEKRPKLLGLSATLLNADVKDSDVALNEKLEELKRIFDGEIVTSRKWKEISERYSAKPTEIIEHVEAYEIADDIKKCLEMMCEEGIKLIEVVKLNNNPVLGEPDMVQLRKPDSNRLKLLRIMLKDILMHTNEYGLFVGYTCCQSYILQLYRYMMINKNSRYITLMLYTMNQARLIRKMLFQSMVPKCPFNSQTSTRDSIENMDIIRSSSSGKIRYLYNRLRNINSSDRCIIFVEKIMTAKSLYKILKIFAQNCPTCDIRVDFVVGSNSNPLRNSKEGLYDRKDKKEVLRNFRKGLTNVLVATDILEEGIDVPKCNIVIMFDGIKTFRSYVQSRGRARMKGSEYIILSHSSNTINSRLSFFKEIDTKLNKMIDKKDTSFQKHDVVSTNSSDKKDMYVTPTGATVNSLTAIQTVYLYCATLPRELLTEVIPSWYYNETKSTCSVQLPSNAGISSSIEGPQSPNRKMAKRTAAFETVVQLHKSMLLDDHLDPACSKFSRKMYDHNSWLANWGFSNESEEYANKTYVSSIRVPKFLLDSRPLPFQQCFLHIIWTEPNYEVPSIARQRFCNNLMKSDDYHYGILTRKPWPSTLCSFPVYSDLGEVKVRIEVNTQVLYFTKDRINNIAHFHRILFINILKTVQKFLAYDSGGNINEYFLVPLQRNKKTSKIEISWENIADEKLSNKIIIPTDRERIDQKYIPENYVKTVVTPWYKPLQPFIVCDISETVYLHSKFISKQFESYAEYFEQKHDVKSKRNDEQRMLVVRPITSMLDGIKPRPTTASQKARRKTVQTDTNTYLAPEFCHIYPFPAVLWYKSIVIPSVLHRLLHLLIAEDLRQKIVVEAKVGSLTLPKEDDKSELQFKEIDGKRKSEVFVIKTSEQSPRMKKQVSIRRFNLFNYKPKNLEKRFEKFSDNTLERDTNKLRDYNVSLIDKRKKEIEGTVVQRTSMIPELEALKKRAQEYGPKPHEILEALTLRDAQDVINLERLETLGDSCLKYLVSVSTYISCTDKSEGDLTILRSRLVCNENLFYCGKKLDIGSYVKATHFSTKSFWRPPGFTIPPCFLKNQSSVNSSSSLLELDIPDDEQYTGNVSAERMDQKSNNNNDNSSEDRKNPDENNITKELDFFLGRHTLTPKNLSDVMEALLGVYLQSSGLESAFKILKYFGVLEGIPENLFDLTPSVPHLKDHIDVLLPGYEYIERVCNYQFKNKTYLLRAFTHPSYPRNRILECYQKLEFLGDAVLDFLITSYIYQYCGNLDPGQLTDLRSSLVNNNTFGSLTVRLNLHKFLLCGSDSLLESIRLFEKHQRNRNYSVERNDELLMVTNNSGVTIAEEIEAPKALGDIFESLAGAIFLDSQCDLNTVWRIYFGMMKNEIHEFSTSVPINPVRELYEKITNKVIFSTIEPGVGEYSCTKPKIYVSLKVINLITNETRQYIGRGENLKAAKRAAAKYALRNLDDPKFIIES